MENGGPRNVESEEVARCLNHDYNESRICNAPNARIVRFPFSGVRIPKGMGAFCRHGRISFGPTRLVSSLRTIPETSGVPIAITNCGGRSYEWKGKY